MPSLPRKKRSWRNALIATTSLSVLAILADLLWAAGWPEWAFAVAFLGVWTLISVSWSNVDYNEESSLMMAEIVDSNFRDLHERLDQLEQELKAIRPARGVRQPLAVRETGTAAGEA
jgi:hypothetical protein